MDLNSPARPHDQTRHYAIHGLLNLAVRSSVGRTALDHMDRQLSPFKIEQPHESPDISIQMSAALSGGGRPTSSINAFDIGDNEIIWHGRYKLGRWQVGVEGLARPPLSVTFAGNRFSYKYLFFHILEPLIDYHLGLKGMTLLHAAGVGGQHSAYAFASMSGVGKTSLAVLLLNQGLPQFLGDEFLIVSAQGIAWSFPLPLALFHRNVVSTPSLKGLLTLPARATLAINRVASVLTHGRVRPMLPMRVSQMFPQVTVPSELPVRALSHVVRTRTDEFRVRPLCSSADVVERLLAINRVEFRFFRAPLSAFAAANPSSLAAGHDARCRAVLTQLVERTPCFEISVPWQCRLEDERVNAAMQELLPDLATALAD